LVRFELNKQWLEVLAIELVGVHPETQHCHSEPFGKLSAGSAAEATLCHPERSEGSRDSSSLCFSE
jgi:hypothetical protein